MLGESDAHRATWTPGAGREVHDIGFARTKGFVGGFRERALEPRGEHNIKYAVTAIFHEHAYHCSAEGRTQRDVECWGSEDARCPHVGDETCSSAGNSFR